LFSAFLLKYFYYSNTAQMLKNENLEVFSPKLNMTRDNFKIKITFFLTFSPAFSLSFSSTFFILQPLSPSPPFHLFCSSSVLLL
jgi:hypothetical protein